MGHINDAFAKVSTEDAVRTNQMKKTEMVEVKR